MAGWPNKVVIVNDVHRYFVVAIGLLFSTSDLQPLCAIGLWPTSDVGEQDLESTNVSRYDFRTLEVVVTCDERAFAVFGQHMLL